MTRLPWKWCTILTWYLSWSADDGPVLYLSGARTLKQMVLNMNSEHYVSGKPSWETFGAKKVENILGNIPVTRGIPRFCKKCQISWDDNNGAEIPTRKGFGILWRVLWVVKASAGTDHKGPKRADITTQAGRHMCRIEGAETRKERASHSQGAGITTGTGRQMQGIDNTQKKTSRPKLRDKCTQQGAIGTKKL